MLRIDRFRITPETALGDHANTAQHLYNPGCPGIIRFLKVDYTSTGNAEMDLTLERDVAGGDVIFTSANSETDLGFKAVGTTATDEVQTATGVVDAADGGLPFSTGVNIKIAQMDDASYADVYIAWEQVSKKTLKLVTDVSGDATRSVQLAGGRPAVVRFIQVDYDAAAGAGTTLVAKDGVGGPTVFTKDTDETDFGPVAVGAPGIDEAAGATDETDGLSGGLLIASGMLSVVVASGGSKKTDRVSVWFE